MRYARELCFSVVVVVKCTYTHPCIGIGMLLYIVPGKGIFSSLLIVNTKNITFQIGKRKRVVSAEPLVVWPYPAAPSIESDLLSTKKKEATHFIKKTHAQKNESKKKEKNNISHSDRILSVWCIFFA